MQKLKDVNVMCLNDEAIEAIAATFQQGEHTKQTAFDALVCEVITMLEPFSEERKSGLKLISGALKRARILLEGSVLHTLGLTSTYVQPSLQLASRHIEGTTVPMQYVIDNLTEQGDSEAGDLPGPIFAPSRLIVSLKALKLKENNPFEHDAEEGLMLKGKRFGSYSIEDIKTILRTGKTDPGTLDLINDLIGQFTDEGQKPKHGSLGRFIEKLRKAANVDPEEPDSFALDIAEALETVQMDCREASIRRIREERNEREAKADMRRAKARLNREPTLPTRETVGASVTTQDGDSANEVTDLDEGDDDDS